MNKKFFLIPLIILVFAASVSAVPGIPHRFYGAVDFSNAPAPDNFVVSAKINGAEVASTATLDGRYGYERELLFVSDPYNNRRGKTVEFFVNGIKANETAVFQNGGSQRLDLTVDALVNELIADEAIENRTISAGPNNLFAIGFGKDLDIIISSPVETTATIEEVSGLSGSFFIGKYAVTDLNPLKAYEIKISGSVDALIIIYYGDSLTGIEEDSIAPYKFNGTNWEKIESFTLNKINKTVNFTISSASTPYAIMGSALVEEADPCEAIECNDFNPCTMDECREGTCVYTALPNGMACPNGVCRNGFCEIIEKQEEQPSQTVGEGTQETQPQDESETGEEIQETEGEITEEETKEAEAEETQEEAGETKEQGGIGAATGLFTLDITPSTIIITFTVTFIAVILTFIVSYFLFRKR